MSGSPSKMRLHKRVTLFVQDHTKFEYTQSEIQHNIAEFGVQVDEFVDHNRLSWVYPEQTIAIENWPSRSHGDFTKIQIIEQNDEFLLLYKPAGVVVQPGAGHTIHNLVNWLRVKFPDQARFDLSIYPTAGLVHRLDKDTQGLILVARSEEDLKFFQDQFRNRTTKKKYLTVLNGIMEQTFEVENWQSRDLQQIVRQKLFWNRDAALKYSLEARDARSVFVPKIICPERNETIVEVTIKTGRMHQIRLQAEALGFPLVGERIYNLTTDSVELSQNERTKSYFGIAPIQVNDEKFRQLQNRIFDDEGYALLSNYIKIKTRSGRWLEAQWRDVAELVIESEA